MHQNRFILLCYYVISVFSFGFIFVIAVWKMIWKMSQIELQYLSSLYQGRPILYFHVGHDNAKFFVPSIFSISANSFYQYFDSSLIQAQNSSKFSTQIQFQGEIHTKFQLRFIFRAKLKKRISSDSVLERNLSKNPAPIQFQSDFHQQFQLRFSFRAIFIKISTSGASF